MHFALITAPTITEFRSREEIASQAVQRAALQPQLGILSVAAVLEQWGDCPHLYDANGEYLRFFREGGADRIDDFAHALAERAVASNADVFGLGSICSTFPLTLRIAKAIKDLRPHTTVLMGGPQASVVDEAVLQHFPAVDFILRGEVEATLPALLHQLTHDYAYERVGGLTYRENGAVRRTPNAAAIEDLDAVPTPAYHLSEYLRSASSASIELGRGCPFSCTFCSTNDFFRRRYRLRSPERVLAEMRAIAAEYGIRHFELVHDMFTVDRKRVVAFCECMRNSGEDFTWDCSARTDCVDEALLQQMQSSGCSGLFFGIESGSARMQRIIDKDLDPARAAEMLAAAERLGMRTTASLITGFPEETWDDVRQTLQLYMRSARCSLSHPQINLLAPLAGTPLHTRYASSLVLEEFCSDMSHQGLGSAEADRALIARFPEIFPNFYMIPTPLLRRETLFDLRDFLGMAVQHLRWLLLSVARQHDPLDLHAAWIRWRTTQHGELDPAGSRRYYATPRAREDLILFLRGSVFGEDAATSALLSVEEALLDAAGGSLPSGEEAIVTLAPGVRLLRLPFRLADLIAQLAAGDAPAMATTASTYATRRAPGGEIRLHEISASLAHCIQQIADGDTDALGAALPPSDANHPQLSQEDRVELLLLFLEEQRWIIRRPGSVAGVLAQAGEAGTRVSTTSTR